MWRILIDNDFRHTIMRGLQLRVPHLDIVTTQQVGLTATPDPEILEWAYQEGRLVFSHDTSTMPDHCKERLLAGKSFAGLVIVQQNRPVGEAIEALQELVCCSQPNEWKDFILYLPM